MYIRRHLFECRLSKEMFLWTTCIRSGNRISSFASIFLLRTFHRGDIQKFHHMSRLNAEVVNTRWFMASGRAIQKACRLSISFGLPRKPIYRYRVVPVLQTASISTRAVLGVVTQQYATTMFIRNDCYARSNVAA